MVEVTDQSSQSDVKKFIGGKHFRLCMVLACMLRVGLFRGLEFGSSSSSLKSSSFILRLEYSNKEYLIFNEYLFIFI